MIWPFKQKSIELPTEKKSVSMLFPQVATKFFANTNATFEVLANEGYAVNWAAYACINKIASSMTSVEWCLYRRNPNDKDEKITEHPILDLLYHPSPLMSRNEFFQDMYTTFLISGNAYQLGVGLENNPNRPPLELQLLSPGRMKIEPSKISPFPLYYEYKKGSNDSRKFLVDQVTGRSPIMHLKSVNPLSDLYGLSPLIASAFSIDIINSGKKWNKKLLDNDARPSGALTVRDEEGKPSTLSDDQYRRLREMVDQMFSGSNNAGRPLLLEGGLEWEAMSMNPRELDFVKGAYSAASDVAIAMGVPPQLIGIPGSNTYANMEQAKLGFWTETVIPWLCWFIESYNRWLIPLYDKSERLYLHYDEEMIPALEPLRKQRFERVNNASFMTVNEKRRAVGLDALPEGEGGDKIFVPQGHIPLDLAGDALLSEPDAPLPPKKPKDKE